MRIGGLLAENGYNTVDEKALAQRLNPELYMHACTHTNTRTPTQILTYTSIESYLPIYIYKYTRAPKHTHTYTRFKIDLILISYEKDDNIERWSASRLF